ncbi:MAG TPA: hypothetical protein VKZ87_06820 [Ferrovibrio sp.]|uniref:hypothetical protein n=1 Tax=Ferrovibrio sp. TaxID=1917215 RepID=UPI002B4B76F3|nr:hypothetical protein [Ferrovibrio sp.]HLT77081.1 hypothetical protein [Ferrovibrio sp.]
MTDSPEKQSAPAMLRRNFGLGIANGTLVDASDQIASANIVVPWLLHALGAFPFISSAAVPLVRAGQLAAGIAAGPVVVRAPLAKQLVGGATLVKAAALAGMALAAWLLPPLPAIAVIIALLLLVGIANGLGGLGFRQLAAKAIPAERRGALLALRLAAGGGLTVILLLFFYLQHDTPRSLDGYGWKLLLGAACLVLGALAILLFFEVRGARGGTSPSLADGWRLTKTSPWFRRYLSMRAVAQTIDMAVPFFAMHAANVTDASHALGLFVAASTIGGALAGLGLARVLDRHVHLVLRAAPLLALAATAYAFLLDAHLGWRTAEAYAPVFFVAAVAGQSYWLACDTLALRHLTLAELPAGSGLAGAVASVSAMVMAFVFGLIAHGSHMLASLAALALLLVLSLLYVERVIRLPARAAAQAA